MIQQQFLLIIRRDADLVFVGINNTHKKKGFMSVWVMLEFSYEPMGLTIPKRDNGTYSYIYVYKMCIRALL